MVCFALSPQQQLEKNVREMCPGLPGAITLLMSLPREVGVLQSLQILRQMKEMNIVGSNVWVAFEFGSGSDLGKMIEAIRNNDEAFVEVINKSAQPGQQARVRG
jgi:hypothetical protein